MGHPGITEAAVIGQASDKWGESPLAIVVKNDEALSEEILTTVRTNSLNSSSQKLLPLSM